MGHPYGAPVPYAAPAPARKRWPLVLLIVVIVLVGLAVVADRVALSFAENKAASTLQSSQHLSNKPDVSVAGFPFLTQLVAGKFDDVTISASGVDVGTGRTLHIASVTVHLRHVTVPRDYASVRASTATADALIAYPDLSQTLGVTVRDGGSGRLVAKPSVTVAGQTINATVSARVRASSAKGISFDNPKVSVGGIGLSDAVSRALAAVFEKVISLQGLPFGVQVQGVEVSSSGLILRLSGHDLVYTRS